MTERIITLTDETERDRWTAFVAQWPSFELMQSYEWGAFKEALGWKTVRLIVDRDGQWVAGAQMLIKPLPLGVASIAYLPRGPLLRWEDAAAAQTLLPALHAAARKQRAISLKIEPPILYSAKAQQQLQAYGFRRSPFNNQPQCTMLIDLTPDEDTILANMHKTTRYNIRYSARQGVVVREATVADLDTFFRLIESTATRTGFSPRSYHYYHREWDMLAPRGYLKLFLATYGDEVLAARMPAVFGHQAATLHSGSVDTLRQLKPNELLMWTSLQWAKAQGCMAYDMWGIPDEIGANLCLGKTLPEKQTGGLWGVYQFKRGFGGSVAYFVGAFDFVYSPLLYKVMNAATAQLGSLEKLAQWGDRLDLRSNQPAGM